MFGLMRIKIHEDELERLGKSFVSENAELREACLQEQEVLQAKYDAQTADLKSAIALNKLLCAEKDEWTRQNTALQEHIDKLFIVVQQADIDKAALQEQLGRKVADCIRLQEERDSLQDRCDVLQAQYDHLQTSNEHIAAVDITLSADYAALQQQLEQARSAFELSTRQFAGSQVRYEAAMALLAELYEARVKKGSVKFWDTRYLDLQAQYDQLAPVEAVEAKEE